MIKSMTGFARSTGGLKKGHWSVEIRSLNHRYFEFSLKTPPSLYGLEDRIRELCQTRIKRGKVTVSINEGESTDSDEIVLDEKVLRFYLSAIRKIQRRLGLKGPLSMSDVLTLPRIFSVQKKALAPESLWHVVKVPLEIALSQLLESRTREGKVLSKDIVGRLGRIEGKLTGIEKRTTNFPEEYYEKLKGRIQKLYEEKVTTGDRVWQEAALLAEKADVTEEMVRLKGHIDLFRKKITSQDEVGKELDFLLQEMNREVNTLSAKSQDFEISREVVSIKAELEKIREQVQNIE